MAQLQQSPPLRKFLESAKQHQMLDVLENLEALCQSPGPSTTPPRAGQKGQHPHTVGEHRLPLMRDEAETLGVMVEEEMTGPCLD